MLSANVSHGTLSIRPARILTRSPETTAKLTQGVLDSVLELGKLLNVQSLKGLPFIGQISS